MVFAAADLFIAPLRTLRKKAVQSIEKRSRYIKKSSLWAKTEHQARRNSKPSNHPRSDKKRSHLQRAHTFTTGASGENVSGVSFWMKYICLELPARKVAHALFLMGEGKELSVRNVGLVILGIAMSPAFAIGWCIRRLTFYFFELHELIGKYEDA